MDGCKGKMGEKRNVVLYLDGELVRKTRELGFNLSKMFENQLKHLINHFYSVNTQNNSEKNIVWCGGRDLNPRRPMPTGPKPVSFDQTRTPPHCFLLYFC